MSVKILQVVNSALFGLPGPVHNPTQAILLLGLETTRLLVLSTGAFTCFTSKNLPLDQVEKLWGRSLRLSNLARCIAAAELAPATSSEQAALAGLLHEIGKLLLLAYLPQGCQEVEARMEYQRLKLDEAERAVFGATHAQVGAYLLGLWGLPDPIVEAVAWYRNPSDCPGTSFCPLTAVHVAQVLDQERADPETGQDGIPLDRAYLQRLGRLHRLEAWRACCQTKEPKG